MNNLEIFELLQNYYEVTQIPMKLYSNHTPPLLIPDDAFTPNPVSVCQEFLQVQTLPVCYTILFDCMLAGLIHCEESNQYILAGPALLFNTSAAQAVRLLNETHQNPDRLNEFLFWLSTLPVVDSGQFQHILHFLDYSINKTTDIRVLYVKDKAFSKSAQSSSQTNGPQTSEHIDIIQENLYSARILNLVASGNVLELQKTIHSMTKQNFGPQLISLNADRFIKNIFIGANSLVCRAAIIGGLAAPVALSLSDYFIVKIETCRTYDAVLFLLCQMMIQYTTEVSKIPTIPSDSLLVRKIIRSIQNHLYEKQSSTDIALELDMDLSYLCRHFKQETGETISYYINKIKIEESKRLMEMTELSLSQIAMQLGYSSQSYFQRVFKKTTGVTPKVYRLSRKLQVSRYTLT